MKLLLAFILGLFIEREDDRNRPRSRFFGAVCIVFVGAYAGFSHSPGLLAFCVIMVVLRLLTS